MLLGHNLYLKNKKIGSQTEVGVGQRHRASQTLGSQAFVLSPLTHL